MLTLRFIRDVHDHDMWNQYHVTLNSLWLIGSIHCDMLYDMLDDLGLNLHDVTAEDGANTDRFDLRIFAGNVEV